MKTAGQHGLLKRHNRLLALLLCGAALAGALISVWLAWQGDSAHDSNIILFSLALATSLMLVAAALSLYMLRLQHLADHSTHLLTSAMEQSQGAVVITDAEGRIEYVNARYCQITGRSREELLGTYSELVRSDTAVDKQQCSLPERLSKGEIWSATLCSTRRSGERYWQAVSAAPVLNDHKVMTHIVLSVEDTSQQRELHAQLEKLAYFDPLTGLENRRMFRDRLEQALRHLKRHKSGLALLFIDLDGFKHINDSLGHDAGDELLISVAQRIRSHVRDEDIVARLGGDEFTVLLTHQHDSSGAGVVASKILRALREPFALRGMPRQIGASIGIALAPEDGLVGELLMRNADLAMYRAKDLGRNNAQYYSEDMNIRMGTRQTLEEELREAIQQERFVVHFQPQVDLAENRITGFEALVRWQHASGERLPGSFLPLAEQTGLIVELGAIVMRKACGHLKRLQELGMTGHTVSINLSARQFRDPSLLVLVQSVLDDTGLDARWLELEITESMLMENIEQASGILRSLRMLGLSISIDDFGTGHSSLGTLSKLPVNKLKVDRSFIHNLTVDAHDRAITTAVIALAHKLGLTVVAEGVENAEQSDFLLVHHCSFQQGYEFGAPVSFAELPGSISRLQGLLDRPVTRADIRH